MLAVDLAVVFHSFILFFSTGGTILQNSVVKMCSVQIMVFAMMGCGVLTVHVCQVLQAVGKLAFDLHILCLAKCNFRKTITGLFIVETQFLLLTVLTT